MIVDDRQLAVNSLLKLLIGIDPKGSHKGFLCASEAIEYQRTHPVDVAFLDIEMPDMDGIHLTDVLMAADPQINVVLVTGHNEYALDAHRHFVSGYLLKPVRKEELEEVLRHLRHPLHKGDSGNTAFHEDGAGALPAEGTAQKRLQIRCFGNFDVFVDNVPLHFKRSKTRELLAYLVDRRGATCTMGELLGILWEDRPDSASQRTQLRNLIHDLKSALEAKGCASALIRGWNSIAVDVTAVDCDYYRYLDNSGSSADQYRGEYMKQYSWAETTNAYMLKQSEQQ